MSGKIALIGLAALGLAILAGCIYGPKRVTYNALAGTEITVDTAMTAWGEYVKDFHPPVSQETQVADAYAKYQVAEEAAIDAARLSITLTDSTDAQAKLTAARQQATQALGELVSLLRQFGVKI